MDRMTHKGSQYGTYDAQQHLHTALVQCAGADPGLGACPPREILKNLPL